MEKILIPTDFSKTAENALTYSAHLGKVLEADLHLLHTYELPRKTALLISIERHLVGEAQKEISEESARLAAISGMSRVTSHVRRGYNDELIASEADKMESDLIVMGTKGASGFKEVFLGSNTVRAIKRTDIPVMVVPIETQYKPIEKILLAVDDIFFGKPECLKPLKELLEKTEAQLIALHVNKGDKDPSPTPFRTLLTEQFGTDNYEFHEVDNPNTGEAIMDFSYKINADLVCMIHHYRNFLDGLFKSSTTYKAAFHTDTPLLVLKD